MASALPALWLADPNIDWGTPHIMGLSEVKISPIFKDHWQSHCTALTECKHLPLGLCKQTVEESTPLAVTPVSIYTGNI